MLSNNTKHSTTLKAQLQLERMAPHPGSDVLSRSTAIKV